MDEKKNLTLINRITGFFGKTAKAVRREETTETGSDTGIVSYYYKKIQLERTRLAKYGDYVLMDEEYPEISTALDLYADNATKEKNEAGNVFEIKSNNAKVHNILN
jgi:hypothetical protein